MDQQQPYGQYQYYQQPQQYYQGQPDQPPQQQAYDASQRTSYYSAGGGQHSYSLEETRSFAEYLNQLLGSDPDLKDVLPLNPYDNSLFTVASQGLLLCKLINAIKPGTINEKKIVKPRNKFETISLHNLAIQGAKELGCTVVNIGASDLEAGTPHLVLGLVWQAVKVGLLSKLNLDSHPELVTLLAENEDVKLFMKVAPETNLLRWFNYHLRRAGHPRQVNNFSTDIRDAENYLVLLSQIAPHVVPRDAFRDPDPRNRASAVVSYADQLGCKQFVTPEDILSGNEKLNLAFTAYLFNKYPGLEVTDDNLAAQRALKEAEEVMRAMWAEEDEKRRRRWEEEDRERQAQWEAEMAARRAQLEQEEMERRRRWEEEERRLKESLSEAERQQREALEREAEARRQKLWELEQLARQKEEEMRREEERRERMRIEEEERRRRWEAEQRRLQMLAQEQAARREEEMRRAEEERRRQWEEYYRQQEEHARRMEEERRRREWELEQQRQQAWAQYHAQQQAAIQQQEYYRQQQIMQTQQQWAQYQLQQQMMRTTAYTTTAVAAPSSTVVTSTTTTYRKAYPLPRLTIIVVQARRLAQKDTFSKSDPYCVLIHNGTKYKTRTVKNTNDPSWNEQFDFVNVQEYDEIIIDVYDKDRLTKQDFVNGERWYQLQSRAYKNDRVQGDILLRFRL